MDSEQKSRKLQNLYEALALFNYPFMSYREWKAKILQPYNRDLCFFGPYCKYRDSLCKQRHDKKMIKDMTKDEYEKKTKYRMLLHQDDQLKVNKTLNQDERNRQKYFKHFIFQHSQLRKSLCLKASYDQCQKFKWQVLEGVKERRKEQFLKEAFQSKNYLMQKIQFGKYKYKSYQWIEDKDPKYIDWLADMLEVPNKNFTQGFVQMIKQTFTTEFAKMVIRTREKKI